ncbi:MAG: pseudouridine synthase [Lachnospiraceae bacterium]|nr:pseudouridine synthase [Lachnospiraceae bacterium]
MSDGIRLNKYLADAALCSRRQADKLIEAGEIKVDGTVADLGTRVYEGSVVMYKGKIVKAKDNLLIYAYNKPIGLVCTSKEADKDSIFGKVEFPERVNYVGRLDKDSSGLLLLTNDGELANAIQKARNNHEKEYLVRVNKDIDDAFIEKMSKGVPILDTVTKKCKVEKTGTRTFRIILTQGLNRQIRRMCDYCGYRVVNLKRVRVMNVKLGDLRPGAYRALTASEEAKLRNMISD